MGMCLVVKQLMVALHRGGADDRWFVKIDCSALQQLVTLAGPSLPSVLIANDALGS